MIARFWLWLTRAVLALRYRVRVVGLEQVLAGGRRGVLVLANHPALIDPVILLSRLWGPLQVRTLADRRQIDRLLIRRLAKRIGAIPIADAATGGKGAADDIRRGLEQCAAALRSGGNVLLYPSGHVYRNRYERIGANRGALELIEAASGSRVVLVRTTGLWGSSFSWASGREPNVAAAVRRGVRTLLAGGLLFAPRREVTIELVEPKDLPISAGRDEFNRYLETFYNADAPPATYVPYTPWEPGGTRELPAGPEADVSVDVSGIPADVRNSVTAWLAERSGVDAPTPDAELAAELGLDSLAGMDLVAWLHSEFGWSVENVESLRTVADVMHAAVGAGVQSERRSLPAAAKGWFGAPAVPTCPDDLAAKTIPQALAWQARRQGGRAILADPDRGVRTYREVVTACLAMRAALQELPGERLGVMLPAGLTASTVYLAALASGRSVAMANWTLGPAVLGRCLDVAGVRAVLTARALTSRLSEMGVDLGAVSARFVYLEELAGRIGLATKLSAALRARVRPGAVVPPDMGPDSEAVVLFTSGSEAEPKAVPLTHRNLLTNVSDLWRSVSFEPGDRLLGILPPFHAFGLTTSTVLPIALGMPVAYWPNPTDGTMLAQVAEVYRPTLLAGTPTFLAGLVRAAAPGQLESLKMVVAGAETCPDRTWQLLESACPQTTLLEGYGATECSPVVTLNRPGRAVRGTIGEPLPSVETVVADPETLEPIPTGQRGVLLARGPSVFGGYLNEGIAQPFVSCSGDDWYDTGDLVTADDGGVITFAGRRKRFVKLGGEMVSLPAVEAALNAHLSRPDDDGPILAVLAEGDDPPVLVLVTTRDCTRAKANRAIRSAGLSGLHNVRRVERIEDLPLLGTGKVDYRALKAWLEVKTDQKGEETRK